VPRWRSGQHQGASPDWGISRPFTGRAQGTFAAIDEAFDKAGSVDELDEQVEAAFASNPTVDSDEEGTKAADLLELDSDSDEEVTASASAGNEGLSWLLSPELVSANASFELNEAE
jgi:hypothetical protein